MVLLVSVLEEPLSMPSFQEPLYHYIPVSFDKRHLCLAQVLSTIQDSPVSHPPNTLLAMYMHVTLLSCIWILHKCREKHDRLSR